MSEKESVNYRIGAVASLLLGIFAIFLDVTELGLDAAGTFLAGFGVVFGYLKDFATLILIPGIFLILGAPFWKGKKAKKKMVVMVSGFLISLLPWLGAVMPETFISVAVTIYLTRKEDEEKVKERNAKTNILRARRVREKVRRISSE